MAPCNLFNITKLIYRLDFLLWTAYHEINVHVHGAIKYPYMGGKYGSC